MNTNNLQRGRLYSTSIYDMFTQNASNRPQHEDSVVEESMRAHGFLSAFPIRCSHGSPGKLVVNQGHHRLHYAKRLKIPVYFVIDDTPIDIWELEGSSKNRWSSADFVESRARSGHPEYRALIMKQAIRNAGGQRPTTKHLFAAKRSMDNALGSSGIAISIPGAGPMRRTEHRHPMLLGAGCRRHGRGHAGLWPSLGGCRRWCGSLEPFAHSPDPPPARGRGTRSLRASRFCARPRAGP